MTQYVDIEEFNALKAAYIDTKKTLTDTVELLANALKRISQLENTLFAKNEDGEIIKNEENKPVISLELQVNKKIVIEPLKEEPTLSPKTTLEKKAVAFAEWLLKKPYSPTGVIQADDKEIKEFINTELPEKLRGKDKSDRKIKMRIINKVRELYPNKIEISKNQYVRHETGVFVKDSFQLKRTVRTPLFLAGELI
jgi:hypothetical protein